MKNVMFGFRVYKFSLWSALGIYAALNLLPLRNAHAQSESATTEPARPSLLGTEKTKEENRNEKSTEPKAPSPTNIAAATAIFSDDWWRHTRPIFEIHGFFRTRGELFHNFSLGRLDSAVANSPGSRLFPRPLDDTYTDITKQRVGPNGGAPLCGKVSPTDADCTNSTLASANMRFRIDPEIHISDNLRILSQIDFLDNVVLGSTPEGSAATPGTDSISRRSGYIPLRSLSMTQVPPVAGVNSFQNSISVKRVWAEYATPLGQLRFGRMPFHWGLGIFANAGNKLDSDYQSHVDRIGFTTGLKNYDLYFSGAWDFPNSGRTSQTLFDQQGQPYNMSQNENTNQWVLQIYHALKPEVIRQKLARGNLVINGGLMALYRQQILTNEIDAYSAPASVYQANTTRVGTRAFVSDFWLQLLAKDFRWETEVVYVYGGIENPIGASGGDSRTPNAQQPLDYKLRQLGIATEFEYRALNDDLHLRFNAGFASGDQGVPEGLAPGNSGFEKRLTSDRTVSTFRFHPDYRLDLILFRNILNRVQGVYYFKPSVEYDFTRSQDGERLGGRVDAIYSRASKAVQTPGHKEDLGLEFNVTLYYQSKDGSLNNDPTKLGGFYAMVQYGVLIPLGGLGYMSQQVDPATNKQYETSIAQTARLFLGVAY